MLDHLDGRGRLVSDVQSTSRDFLWCAGRDRFLPVRDGAGEWVAMLVVRVSGADLRGVPDSVSHHEAGAREGLGNLKREAEDRFRRAGGVEPLLEGAVPAFRVLGRE
jgi:hypothetical protein